MGKSEKGRNDKGLREGGRERELPFIFDDYIEGRGFLN